MDANTTTEPGYRQPALIGGAVMGVLSALPFVNALNFCCCLWVITGGLVAAYLLQQSRSTPITAGDGAFVGLLAGIAGAFISLLVSIPLGLIVGPMEQALIERLSTASGTMPPEVQQMLENLVAQRREAGVFAQIIGHIVVLCVMLVAGAIFSTLGGLLGAALFARKPAMPSAPL